MFSQPPLRRPSVFSRIVMINLGTARQISTFTRGRIHFSSHRKAPIASWSLCRL